MCTRKRLNTNTRKYSMASLPYNLLWWSLVIVRDNYSCLVIIIRLHHYQWWRLLFLSVLLFFFLRTRSLSDKHETCTGMDSIPDPLSTTLTYFSRSQTHFSAKNPKLQIHITSSFMVGCRWNFVGMDSYMTPCWRHTFRWPWPSSSGQTRNGPEIFCHRFGQI